MPRIIPSDRLLALLNQSSVDALDQRPRRIPYPPPAGVLYDPPNPDGSRKRCGNCYKFVMSGTDGAEGRCVEVGGEMGAGQVCGLFVWGAAQPAMPLGAPRRKVDPGAAGLIDTPDGAGTACDICRFFDAGSQDPMFGLCSAVGAPDGYPPVIVDARGCCARWEVAPGR